MKLQLFFEKYQYLQNNDFARIIGGQAADPGEYPWQVMVIQVVPNSGAITCGGTLIFQKWVITAYHCVGDRPKNHLIVLGGYVHPVNQTKTDEIVLGVKKIKLHPRSGVLLEKGPYDIALLKMKAKVTYGPKIFPACVPGPDYRYETGKLVTTTGWGLTQSDPPMKPKGQLISKCPFGFIVWTKLPTELFLNFCPEIFCTFLGASWKLFGAFCRLPCL